MACGKAICFAAGALLLLPGAAAAQEAPRAVYSDQFTVQTPSTSTGRDFSVDILDPDNPDGKPPAIEKVRLELAEGARFDTVRTPQCKASDVELMLAGASACPADSQVGTGTVDVDTGLPGPARFINTTVEYFNNENELIILFTEAQSGGRVVLRGRIGTNTLEIDVPPLPGTPPDGGSDTGETAAFGARTTPTDAGDVAYLATPPECPASGVWVNRLTYTFRDGVVQTFESQSPCVAEPSGAAADPSRGDEGGGTESRGRRRGGEAAPRRTAGLPAGGVGAGYGPQLGWEPSPPALLLLALGLGLTALQRVRRRPAR